MADNRDMMLEDAIEDVVRGRTAGAERALTSEETLLVAIGREGRRSEINRILAPAAVVGWPGSGTDTEHSTHRRARMGIATTAKAYEIRSCPPYFQIVDREDGCILYSSRDPKEAIREFRRLSGGAEQVGFLWELEAAKQRRAPLRDASGARYSRVYVALEACDKNIDRVRALYREIKGRELDESRTREQGYYRYPAGPRNANPEHEKTFGHRIEYRVRYYTADGKIEQYSDMEVALGLLLDGYDLGYNDLR